MVFGMGSYLLGRAISQNSWPACKLVLEGFLIGDVTFTTLCILYVWKHQVSHFAALANIAISGVLGVARVAALYNPVLAGFTDTGPGAEAKAR